MRYLPLLLLLAGCNPPYGPDQYVLQSGDLVVCHYQMMQACGLTLSSCDTNPGRVYRCQTNVIEHR